MISKANYREELKQKRNAISTAHRQRKSIAACSRALASFSEAPCVAVYSGIASELSPRTLARCLQDAGALVVYPRVNPTTRVLDFCSVRNFHDFQKGPFGLMEPGIGCPIRPLETINAFLVPALGFDPCGHRLGWGKGYYDHTLAQCPDALRVGICFQEQIIAALPREPTDEPVDLVITDTQIYRTQSRHWPTARRTQP